MLRKNCNDKINLSGIIEDSLVNGPGLRKVFFSQGCSHKCKNCFNPTTWPFSGGKLFLIKDLVNKVLSEPFLSGVTFSGGDPFQQADKFSILAEMLHKNKINIWAYTGYYYEELLAMSQKDNNIFRLLSSIDVLVDGPYIDDQKDETLKYRGSKNQRIIDVVKSLKTKKISLLNY